MTILCSKVYEQPDAIIDTFVEDLQDQQQILLSGLEEHKEVFQNVKRIIIIALALLGMQA